MRRTTRRRKRDGDGDGDGDGIVSQSITGRNRGLGWAELGWVNRGLWIGCGLRLWVVVVVVEVLVELSHHLWPEVEAPGADSLVKT